jgi:hypothetical protein
MSIVQVLLAPIQEYKLMTVFHIFMLYAHVLFFAIAFALRS